MDIEEVKKILREVYWEEFDYSQPEWKKEGEKYFNDKAQQICQLFEAKDTEIKELKALLLEAADGVEEMRKELRDKDAEINQLKQEIKELKERYA